MSGDVKIRGSAVRTDDDGTLLFDRHPIHIGQRATGGFRFRGRSVDPVGRPSVKEFQEAIALASEFFESSPWWIAGLVSYGESRADWKEKLSQAMSVTKLARATLLNLGYIYRSTTEATRALAPSPGHADAVAKLTEPEQVEWLGKARSEELTVRELRLGVQQAKRRKVIEGQAVLEGLHRVLMVDFPWKYSDRPPSGKGAHEHYEGMTIEAGLALPVAAHCTPNAAMGFWVPAPLLYYCSDDSGIPDALRLIRGWGFTPKAQIIWDKVDHNYGHYVSVRHEIFILCTRGSCTPDRVTPMIDSVYSERPGEHSAKPAHFRKALERMWDGPYLELFGREPVEGWKVYGDDAHLWGSETGGVKELVTT